MAAEQGRHCELDERATWWSSTAMRRHTHGTQRRSAEHASPQADEHAVCDQPDPTFTEELCN